MFQLGDGINHHWELEQLPVGTVLEWGGCHPRENTWLYTKQPDGRWLDHSDNRLIDTSIGFFALDGSNRIRSLPAQPTRPTKEAHVINPEMRALLPLRYIEDAGEYSVYEDREGEEFYLQHGTGKVLTTFDEIVDELADMWATFQQEPHLPGMGLGISARETRFRERVQDSVIDPEEVEYEHCNDCHAVMFDEDSYGVGDEGGNQVCESCYEQYYTCTGCEDRYRHTTTTWEDHEVCEYCRDNRYSYCDWCDAYYSHYNSEDHAHNGKGDCCESPVQSFRVANNGEGWLANDTRVQVTLPAGVISDEGIGEMAIHLRDWAYKDYTAWLAENPNDADGLEEHRREYGKRCEMANRLNELGPEWQTKRGNFTKRLSRFAHQEFKLKLPPEVISQIGNIGSDHSRPIDFAIEVTRNLNLPREDFWHDDSCWWTDYYKSRCSLKTNGGYGLRTFNDYDNVEGRAWVMPLKRLEDGSLTPTFNTESPEAFVVFNGYGDLEGYKPARIVAHMAGMTYRKVSFSNSPMYVNGDSAYLVAPEEIAEGYTDGSLHLSTVHHSDLFNIETNEKVLANA